MKRFPEPEYDASGVPNNNYDFFRPEILDIRPIKIYRDDAAELARKKEKERKLKLEIANQESERMRKQLEASEEARKKIKEEAIREFQQQTKNKK